ncbi:MAG: hypothetical protein KKB50_17265 [Planctomycetes bacterium]|nr:hypothetical protein [Planctomycetota bacterium]
MDTRLKTHEFALLIFLPVAVVGLGIVSLHVESEMAALDRVLKNAGLERKDIAVFHDARQFFERSLTDGIMIEDGHIVGLRLIGSQFDDIRLLLLFRQLRHLNLYGNRLRSAAGLELLTELRRLNLAGNPLERVERRLLEPLRELSVCELGDTPLWPPSNRPAHPWDDTVEAEQL